MFEVIGNTYRAIGELEKANDFLNRGTKLFEAAYGSEDQRTLGCRVKLGRARLQSGDSLVAIQILETADCLDKQASDSTEIRDQINQLTLKNASKPSPKE